MPKASSSTAITVSPIASPRSKVTTGARCADGRRLILITDGPSSSLCSRRSSVGLQVAAAEAGCDDQRRAEIGQVLGGEIDRIVACAVQRIGNVHRQR